MKSRIVGKNYYNQLKTLLSKCYCPLTGIAVSAVIVTDKGVFEGVNYEDTICSLSMCAERCAIYAAIPHGMRKIYEVHILSPLGGITMCAVCRQLAWAFGDQNTRVYTYNLKTKGRKETTLGQLLPDATVLVRSN